MPDVDDHTSHNTRKPRICILVTNDMFSDSRVDRHARTLASHGFEVAVVCSASDRTSAKESRENFRILRVRSGINDRISAIAQRLRQMSGTTTPHQRLLSSKNKDLKWVVKLVLRTLRLTLFQLAMLRAARRINADIYCSNDLDTLLIGVVAKGHSSRLVYDSHELWPDMLIGVPEYGKMILRSWEGILSRRADAVMTVNEFIADVLMSRYSLKPPIYVVYNCPTPATHRNRAPGRRNRRLKVVLYHGGLTPERGLENLVRAAHHLLPDIVLTFRGSGIIEGELRNLASGLSNVRFEPPVEMRQVVDAASRADVGVIPYLPTNLCNYYSSPNKLFEYIEAGLPIAASNLPFMKKIIFENEIGAVFDPRDPSSIAEVLNKMTRTPALNRYKRNITWVRRKYNWNVEMEKLVKVYEGLYWAPTR